MKYFLLLLLAFPLTMSAQTDPTELLKTSIDQQTDVIEDPTNPAKEAAYLKRGIAYMALNELGNAKADFAETVRLNPENPEAQFYLGLMESSTSESGCERIKKAKALGYKADWSKLEKLCPGL